jgi:hypothetical protein
VLIEGVSQVVVEVEDRDRALRFWTETMEFEFVQDAPCGEGTLDRSSARLPPSMCSARSRTGG